MNQVILALGFGLVTSAIVAIGAVGFTLQFGVSHIFNVAYGAVMTAAAYMAYFAHSTLGLNLWLAIFAGAAGAALLSVVMQRGLYAPFLRRGSNVFAVIMVSLGVGIAIQGCLQAIAGPNPLSYGLGQQQTIRLGDLIWTRNEVVIMAIAVASMLALHGVLRFTRIGKAMRAVADDPGLARACGMDSRRITTIAWAVSGGLCGIAGGVLALESVTFGTDVGVNSLFLIIAAAVVGGVGEPYGAMLGALVVGLSSQLAAIVDPALSDVVPLLLLVIVLLARPDGLRSGGAIRQETVLA